MAGPRVVHFGILLLSCFSLQQTGGKTIDEEILNASKESSGVLGHLQGNAIRHELDMILTRTQYRALLGPTKTSLDNSNTLARRKRKALKRVTSRWTNNEVPYTINKGTFSSDAIKEIKKAIKEWEDNTCITFRQATKADINKVIFNKGSRPGCYSSVGMSGGEQVIGLDLGCRYQHIIVHEIGHAIGFYHEQSRPDRDSYVIIHRQNVRFGKVHNFRKYSSSKVSTEVPYDYRSLMHYGKRAFSMNGMLTIETKDKNAQDVIGNARGLSFLDMKFANTIYNCSKNCPSSIQCPSGSFLDKNCKCQCPGDPTRGCFDPNPGNASSTWSTTSILAVAGVTLLGILALGGAAIFLLL